MSPDEVVERLSMLGIQMTRRTVLNYENGGLIKKAERGGGGTGGRWANYHKTVIAEIYAAWSLIHGQYVKHDLEGLNELFDNKPPKFTPKIIALAKEWYMVESEIDFLRNELDEVEIDVMDKHRETGFVNYVDPIDDPFGEFMDSTEYKANERVRNAMNERTNILSKIPKGTYALILWVKELWELERNKAIVLEEQLIKTLE